MLEISKRKIYLDIMVGGYLDRSDCDTVRNYADFCIRKNVNQSVLFSKGNRTGRFYTEDSKLYISPKEQELMDQGKALNRTDEQWDGLSKRIVESYVKNSPRRSDILIRQLEISLGKLNTNITNTSKNLISQMSMVRLWNMSIVGAILIGMFSMTLIYKYLGPGARAGNENLDGDNAHVMVAGTDTSDSILTERDEQVAVASNSTEYIERLINAIDPKDKEERKKESLEKEIREMVSGYPIEKMIPHIIEKDSIVAAFLVSIAKKESNWGKRVPVLNGQDCYNYWGYRGIRRLMGTGGHTCFNSRKDAVDTVAKRIEWLVQNKKLNTPEKMIIWKCGSTCAGHSSYSVQKWISDVELYFGKLND